MSRWIVLALLVVAGGCQGIAPAVRKAQLEADAAIARYKAGYDSVALNYVQDLNKLLGTAALAQAIAELRSKAADGKVGVDDAIAVLKADASQRQRIATKMADIRARLASNDRHYQTYRDLSAAVARVLEALEARKQADDQLNDETVRAVRAGVKAAKAAGGAP